jgi:hypothetical protein
MKFPYSSLALVACTLALAACNKLQEAPATPPPAPEAPTFQAIAAKLTIGDKQVDSVIEWNTKTGEARLLNAASFADKASGQQGNLIGWVPLTDLNQAVQNLATQIQQQQAKAAGSPAASPASTPIKAKN